MSPVSASFAAQMSWTRVNLLMLELGIFALIFQSRLIAITGTNTGFSMGTIEHPFKCNSPTNLWCGGNFSTLEDGGLTLVTPSEPNKTSDYHCPSSGLALLPIALSDGGTNRWDSFKTSFRLNITQADGPYEAGDGMAFVMLNVSQYPGNPGRSLGVYDGEGKQVVATLAIEFDPFLNQGVDSSHNHVGINLENITSRVSRNASDVGIILAGSQNVYAWLDYNGSSQIIEVRISLNSSRPDEAFLGYKVNMFEIFGPSSPVSIGFSAANRDCFCYNFYSVHNWSFEHFRAHPPREENRSGNEPPAVTVHRDGGGWRRKLESNPPPALEPSTSKAPREVSKAMQIALIVGIVVVANLVIVALLLFTFWKRKSSGDEESTGIMLDTYVPDFVENLRFSYKELSVATGQFHEESKLGQGGFGSVYRGVLRTTGCPTGQPVAVKRVSADSKQGPKEFGAEVSIISQLRHRNIVRLLGWCSDRSINQFLLVYELMPNGSLDKALFHPTDDEAVLSWKQRFDIIIGSAQALHYLHNLGLQQIIHRDFKSSNIMLDKEWNPMLGDFGLARMVDRHEDPATTIAAGTRGYIAPEVAGTGEFTVKTDVYAFGAVCLEVACGRLAFDCQLVDEQERILVDWVWKKLAKEELMSVVDSRLNGQFDTGQVEMLLLLGLLCSHPNPKDRPAMPQILEILKGSVPMPAIPLTKPVTEYSCTGREYRMRAMNTLFKGSSIVALTETYVPDLDP